MRQVCTWRIERPFGTWYVMSWHIMSWSCHVCMYCFVHCCDYVHYVYYVFMIICIRYSLVLLICYYSNRNIFLPVCLLAITPPHINLSGRASLPRRTMTWMWGVSLKNADWILLVYKLTKWSNPKFSIESLFDFRLFELWIRNVLFEFVLWITLCIGLSTIGYDLSRFFT